MITDWFLLLQVLGKKRGLSVRPFKILLNFLSMVSNPHLEQSETHGSRADRADQMPFPTRHLVASRVKDMSDEVSSSKEFLSIYGIYSCVPYS